MILFLGMVTASPSVGCTRCSAFTGTCDKAFSAERKSPGNRQASRIFRNHLKWTIMQRLVLFDLDNTLVDRLDAFRRWVRAFTARRRHRRRGLRVDGAAGR
ncbi:hypothetical protein [Nonomuraea sp. NPDC050691]|uniref:hypothetical protein n=1 Tax=Nonomuraea sp. NPDC050691 TaxID=3155661 RepID=UPI0033CD8F51